MPRGYLLLPEHSLHVKLGNATDRAYRVYIQMLLHSNSEGCMFYEPTAIRAWTYRHNRIQPAQIVAVVDELRSLGLIHIYTVDGTLYYQVLERDKMIGAIDRPGKSTLPAPPREDLILAADGHPLSKRRKVVQGLPYTPAFERFWSRYPRQAFKVNAWRAWEQVDGDEHVEAIMEGLETDIASETWCRDNGEYIPHPAKWLFNREWETAVRRHQQRTVAPRLTDKNRRTVEAGVRFIRRTTHDR